MACGNRSSEIREETAVSLLKKLGEGRSVVSLPPSATAAKAAGLMAEKRVGSVVIMEGAKLLGIFTEMDLLNKVVAKGLDAQKVSLET